MKAPPFPPGLTAGDVVRCARVAQGIGLRAMCRATGMSPTALSHLETNRPGTSVSAETLALLARHLMLDPWELMLRDGRVRGVRIGDEEIAAEQVLCTLPPPALRTVLPPSEAMEADFARFGRFRSGAAMTFYIGCREPIVHDAAWYTSPRIAPASEGYSGDLVSGWVASSNCVAERAPADRQLFESWCGLTTEEALSPELVANAMRRQWETLTHLHPTLEEHREWTLVTLAPHAYPVLPSPGQVRRSLIPVEPGWFEGLYLVGDAVQSWGCSIDRVMHAAILGVSAMTGEDLTGELPQYMR